MLICLNGACHMLLTLLPNSEAVWTFQSSVSILQGCEICTKCLITQQISTKNISILVFVITIWFRTNKSKKKTIQRPLMVARIQLYFMFLGNNSVCKGLMVNEILLLSWGKLSVFPMTTKLASWFSMLISLKILPTIHITSTITEWSS